jgi:hypothetical protein
LRQLSTLLMAATHLRRPRRRPRLQQTRLQQNASASRMPARSSNRQLRLRLQLQCHRLEGLRKKLSWWTTKMAI